MVDETDPKVPHDEEEDLEEAAASAPPEDLDRTLIRSTEEKEEGEERTPPTRAPLPYVIIVQGPRMGTRFPLSEDKNVIGRSPEAAIRLDDQSVSRQHAEIARVPGGWSIKDLGSKNGTVVNKSPVTEPVIAGHKDVIKVGIYLLRLITQEATIAEEMTLPPDMVGLESTVMTEIQPANGLTGRMDEGARPPARVPEGGPPAVTPPEGITNLFSRLRKYLVPAALVVVVIIAGIYLAQRFIGKPKPKEPPEKPPKVAVPARPAKPTVPVGPPGAPGRPPAPPAAAPTPPMAPPVPAVKKIPVFLDFASSPLPATVMFEGKELGKAPLRVNVELEPKKTYEAEGVFVMPEVGERYVQKVSFTVDPEKPIIPLLFRGPIGIIKINELPRDVQFYLEGKFEYDRFSERPAKLGEIVLRKPIYVPFGTYTLELRRARQLGASQTYVQDIVFRREFTLAADSPSFVLAVMDDDLKVFPVTVRSEPPNADVYIDGKRAGVTPYRGLFPLGEHTMTLRKEGYFEYTEELKVDINTPYTTTVTLQTSVAGAHINNARAAMNRAMYREAINELAEALNSNPAPSEVAKANYMLGVAYLNTGDIQRASGYFELASKHEEQKYQAMLGLVQCYYAVKDMARALPLLVDVLLNAKDPELMREANAVFQKISPLRSVIYIYSSPEGATVTVNDRKVEQATPVILHDLPLGTYKVLIEKPGYLPQELRLSLSVNEFNPVIVTLKPIPQ